MQWGKDSFFNKWCWATDSNTPKNETGSLFIPYTNIYSKWSKDLKGRPETISILEENIYSCSWTLVFLIVFFLFLFLDLTQKARATKTKIDGTTLKKKFLYREGNHQQIQIQPTAWEKIFANHIFNKVNIQNI